MKNMVRLSCCFLLFVSVPRLPPPPSHQSPAIAIFCAFILKIILVRFCGQFPGYFLPFSAQIPIRIPDFPIGKPGLVDPDFRPGGIPRVLGPYRIRILNIYLMLSSINGKNGANRADSEPGRRAWPIFFYFRFKSH